MGCAVLLMSSLATAQDRKTQTWTGWVSDKVCGRSINEACNKKCIDGGTPPVFVVDTTGEILAVSDPGPLKSYPGQHVEIKGTWDGKVLTVAALRPLHDAATPSFTPPPAVVRLPGGKSSLQFPFELLANGIYFPVTVNGKGPYLFGMDTGSSNSVIAAEAAQELGIKTEGAMQGMGQGSSSYEMGMISNLDFALPGGLKMSTQSGAAIGMSGLWPLLARRFYGLIGYDVLGNFVVEIDYEKRLITLHDPAQFHYTGQGVSLPFKLLGGSDPQIQGELLVAGKAPIAVPLTLDTGAGGTAAATPIVNENHLLETADKSTPLPSAGAGNAESSYVLARIAGLKVGPFQVDRPLLFLSQDKEGSFAGKAIGVNLGGNLLRRFTVIIDYPHRQLILEPNSHLRDPQPADASGLVLGAEGADYRTFVVRAVQPGSPASEAGIEPGDKIVGVQGVAIHKYALWQLQELFQRAGQAYRIEVRRGNKTLVRELKLRALL
jgi:hypothetical protein